MMIKKTFAQAPFKMSWSQLIDTNSYPLDKLYNFLGSFNRMMEYVEGTEVNSNRYGVYLLTNNCMLALKSYIKAIEAKDTLLKSIVERQLSELIMILNLIFDEQNLYEITGRDRISANVRLFAGYIFWKDLKDFERSMEPEVVKELEKTFDDDVTFEHNGETYSDRDLSSLLFHKTKASIAYLKLEEIVYRLNRRTENDEKLYNFFTVIKPELTSISKALKNNDNVIGGIMYRQQSEYIHGTYNSLHFSPMQVLGGDVKMKNWQEAGYEKSLETVKTMGIYLFELFKSFWPDEFRKNDSPEF